MYSETNGMEWVRALQKVSSVHKNVMRCPIWHHLYDLKNVKNTHGGVLKPTTLLKLTLLLGCFSRFLNCPNVTKSRKGSHIYRGRET